MRQHWWSRLAQLGRPRRILLAGLAAIYILSLVVFLVTPRAYRTPPVWDGYFTVSTDQDSIRAEALLRDAGASDVITEHTSDVFVTRFSRVDEVPLSTALDQLDPLDPRRDPYIRNLSRYFASDGDSRSRVYVATDQSPRATARMVRRVLGPRSSVAEYRPARRIAGLIVFAVGLSVALIGSGRHWQAVIMGALPLVISVFGAGINGGLSGALILLVWLRALQDADGALEQADSRPGAVPAIYRAGLWLALVIGTS